MKKRSRLIYRKGKYSTLELNAILLDKRPGSDSLIPKSFKTPSLGRFIVSSLIYVMKQVIWVLLRVPFRFKFAFPKNYSEWYDNTTLFVLTTKNNQNALAKVIEKLKQNNYDYKLLQSETDPECYPLFGMYMISLLNLPFLWKVFYQSLLEDRRIIAYYISIFISSPGYPWFFFSVLRKYRPKCVVIANDHSCPTKSLELVCEDLAIKTVYVQHASVSYAFPELHFSYSFLDGKDALNKYTGGDKQSKGEIFLLGAVRYDSLSTYRIHRTASKRNCVGIAINLIDSNKKVNDLCNMLLNYYPDIKIKIRSHPALKYNPFVFDNPIRISYTCASDESIVDYLDSIDFQIAGDSGVHLDAIVGGVKTLAYNFSDNEYGDGYGFISCGLVKLSNTFKDVCEYIEKGCDIDKEKVRIYDESYGKSYAGRCSDIVADLIMCGCNDDYIKSRYRMSLEWFGRHYCYVISK